MIDEEKEAIEYWKRELNHYEYTKDLDLSSDNYFGQFEEKINMISGILNLIEKQQEEIEVYKDIKELAGIEIRDILNWKYENKRLKSEIEKKDKIIDEMAIALYDEWYMPVLNTTEKIKEYFKKKVEVKDE